MLYSDWRVRPYAECQPKAGLEKRDLIVQAAIRRRAKLPECFPNTLLQLKAEKKYGVSEFNKSIPAQRINLPEDEWLQDSIRRHNATDITEMCKGEGWTVYFDPKIVDFQSKVWTPDLDKKKTRYAVWGTDIQ